VAKIQVAYIPIADGAVGAYHQFLLYTRDSGDQYYIRGGQAGLPTADFWAEVSGSKQRTDPSTWGNLVVDTGAYEPHTPDFPTVEKERGVYVLDQKEFDSWHKTDLLEGPETQLDWKWDEIEKHALAIEKQNIPYRPLSQNSNSLVSESLRRSGIEPPGQGLPWGGGIGVRPWAPGHSNRLDFAVEDPAAGVESGGSTRSGILAAALQDSKNYAANSGSLELSASLKPASKTADLGLGN
jgi:hypothetical protein